MENTKAIGVDPQKATLWVGPKLEFDPQTEKFVNAPEADKLLTRNYRAPFVVRKRCNRGPILWRIMKML